MQPKPARMHYRTVWISDLHIGSRGFKAAELLAFLATFDCDYLYLVGDIFDLQAIRCGVVWNDATTDVIRKILKRAHNGTKVYYLPGNHDEEIRRFIIDQPLALGSSISIVDESIHTLVDRTQLLVVHGDIFDFVAAHLKWLSHLGGWLYDRLLSTNNLLHWMRTGLGFRKYWSLSAWLKLKTKRAVSFIRDFESAALHYAAGKGCAGVVTGHIHTPALHTTSGLLYANCGDWIESLSALVEQTSGQLELIRWTTTEG